jgi:signal transduction histidine kinase
MPHETELLKKVPLFETLDTSSLKKIKKLLTTERFKKGKRIIQEGVMGDSLYIIITGEVDVVKGKGGKSEKVATLEPFDFFGEMSLLENKPRSASIIAKSSATLLRLSKNDFEELVSAHPKISFEIMKTLSARIRETDMKLIADLTKKNIELKKAYRDLKNVQDELIKAERLSTIGRVAGGIIHDLKNHLSVVKGYAEYIKHSKDATEPFVNASSTILHVINIILNMTQEILEYARGEYRLETIPLNVDTLLNEVTRLSEKELEKRDIKLHLKLNAQCECEIDPQKMRRVFVNIISNASDAMQDGGELTVETTPHNGAVRISFTDTGTGIDKETLKEIFEPFVSKGKKKGIGLGMSIAKRFVEDHGGRIEVKSKLGKGTTVSIQLPTLPSSPG